MTYHSSEKGLHEELYTTLNFLAFIIILVFPHAITAAEHLLQLCCFVCYLPQMTLNDLLVSLLVISN